MSHRSVQITRFLLALILFTGILTATSQAAKLTAEQRKELASIKRNLGKVATLIRQKKYDEAKTLTDEEEAKLDKLAADAMIPETDAVIVSTKRLIDARRTVLEKAMGGGGGTPGANKGISFESQIAPILNEKCSNCHGAQRASANLNLSTFADMRKGGRSGLLLVPGKSESQSDGTQIDRTR